MTKKKTWKDSIEKKNNKIDFNFSKQASTEHFINFSTPQRLHIKPIKSSSPTLN